MAVYIIEITS